MSKLSKISILTIKGGRTVDDGTTWSRISADKVLAEKRSHLDMKKADFSFRESSAFFFLI
jgi:hypothetical protein